MQVILFANNTVGLGVAKRLREAKTSIAAVVVHSAAAAKRREEIVEASGVPPEHVFEGTTLSDPAVIAAIRDLRPEMGVSAFFGHLLRTPVLELFPRGVINLHPSYLPFNRGHSPNVWSIIDGTPAGVSLHFVDAGVDTGDVIARKLVAVEPYDTGETLYRRLEQECLILFQETWPMIRSGSIERRPQQASEATMHLGRDLAAIDRIDLDRQYTAREIIDILRARTFPPYDGAYFEVDGKRIYMRLQLWSHESRESE